jgi:hypothetical protein
MGMAAATAAAWSMSIALSTPSLHAETIISDTFTGVNGTPIAGRTPDTTDLPGGTWQTAEYPTPGGTASVAIASTAIWNVGGPDMPYTLDSQYGQIAMPGNSSGAMAISIGSNGGYTKPTQFTLSANLNPDRGSVDGNFTNGWVDGEGLGFYSTAPTSDATQSDVGLNFTGLVLNFGNASFSAPSLTLAVNGAGVSQQAVTLNGGAWDPQGKYALSYAVDTATGAISDVAMTYQHINTDGSLGAVSAPEDFTFSTTGFSDSATAFLGILGDSFGRDAEVNVNDVTLADTAAVPEPASLGLLMLAGLPLLSRRRKRA